MSFQLPASVTGLIPDDGERTMQASAFLDLHRLNQISRIRKKMGLGLFDYCQSCVDFAEALQRHEMRGNHIDIFQLADAKRKVPAANLGRVQAMLPLRYIERQDGRKEVNFPPNCNSVSGLVVNSSLIAEYYITLPSADEDLLSTLPKRARRKREEEIELFYSYVPHKIVTEVVHWATLYAGHVVDGRRLMVYNRKEGKHSHAYTFAHTK